MFCTKCGKQLLDGASFCTGCGARLAEVPQPSVTQQPPVMREIPIAQDEPLMQDVPLMQDASLMQEAPLMREIPVMPEASQMQEAPLMQEYSYNGEGYEETTLLHPEDGQPTGSYPAYGGYGAYSEPAQPKKKSGKKLILLIVAAVLAVVLLAGTAIGAVTMLSPKAKLSRAAEKTAEQLELALENSGDFREMLENVAELREDGGCRVEFNYAVGENYYDYDMEMKQSIRLMLNVDSREKQLDGEVNLDSYYSYYGMEEEENYGIKIYANEELLAAEAPELIDGAYSLPLADLGEKLQNSEIGKLLLDEMEADARDLLGKLDINLFAGNIWEEFPQAYKEETDRFLDSIEIEKSGHAIPGMQEDGTVYALCFDRDALQDLVLCYYEYSADRVLGEGVWSTLAKVGELDEDFMGDINIAIYLGISDGCLTAVHLETEDRGWEETATILLRGRENIWEDFALLENGEEFLTGGLEKTGSGFELVLEDGDDCLTVECNDVSGELIVNADGQETVLNYSDEEDGMQISWKMESFDAETRISFAVRPCQEIAELPNDAKNLLDMTMDELQELIYSFY